MPAVDDAGSSSTGHQGTEADEDALFEPPDGGSLDAPVSIRVPEQHRPASTGDVVHDALKGPEVGFKYEVAGLEREARRLAATLANGGLPRHDLESDQPIAEEVVLAQRAGEIYAGWIRRARQKVDAAIATQRGALESAVEGGWHALNGYRDAEQALNRLSPRAELTGSPEPVTPQPATPEAVTPPSSTLHVEADSISARSQTTEAPGLNTLQPRPSTRQVAGQEFHRGYWPLTIALVLAEFVANAPVFTELFPLSVEVERRVTESMANAETGVFLIGFQDMLTRLLASPEPAFLALAAVVFFLFLGHHVGAALRVVVALRFSQPDVSAELIARVRRQAWVALAGAAAGVLIMLTVLFMIRTQVLSIASVRLEAANRQLQVAEAAAAKADNTSADVDRGALRDAVWRAADERDRRVSRMDYASSIHSANAAIFGMNLVLVVVAALAGYFRRELTLPTADLSGSHDPRAAAVDVRDLPPHEPAIFRPGDDTTAEPTLPDKRISELREILRAKREELASSITRADHAYAACKQLLNCNPTAKWEGIADRLGCAIPLFRSENALARKLDQRDVKAFQRPSALQLTAPEERPPSAELVAAIGSTFERLAALRIAALTIRSPGRKGHRASDILTPEVIS